MAVHVSLGFKIVVNRRDPDLISDKDHRYSRKNRV